MKTKSIGMNDLRLALRMLRRGKIDLKEAFLGQPSRDAESARQDAVTL